MDFREFANATCVRLVTRGLNNVWLSEIPREQVSARILCLECPVKTACAARVSQIQPTAGVWAGVIIGSPSTEELFADGRKRVSSRRSRAKAASRKA